LIPTPKLIDAFKEFNQVCFGLTVR
jgi:hypothetical protein